MKFVPKLTKFWSFQASMLLMVVTGAVAGLGAFTDLINPWYFLALNVAGYAIIGLLRSIKQDKVDDDDA